LSTLLAKGIRLAEPKQVQETIGSLTLGLAQIAGEAQMAITSCAEYFDLAPYGVKPGKCMDDDLVARLTGKRPTSKKDPSQRQECGCVQSCDIGMYNPCLFGCLYCYATQNFTQSAQNYRLHNSQSPSLLGWYDVPETQPEKNSSQLRLFE
jgi:hypothetical protein